MTSRPGPLAGLRIIDMSSMLLGPVATGVLADFGADVIKVEPPEGDGRRTIGPARHPLMTSQFLNMNRGKRSIVVDLRKPGGRDVVLRLCRGADAFIHNSRRKAMEKLRLTHANVAAVNEGIVYCAAVGFGAGGPYAERPAYDDMIQGLAAIPSLQARAIGKPAYVPLNLSDRVCGLVFAQIIMAALLHKARTGEGQYVELPMFETMAEFVLSEHLCGHVFEPPVGDLGADRMFQRRPARTRDGHLCFWIGTDDQYARFVDVIGRPGLKQDARFARRADRNRNLDAFYEMVDEALAGGATADWVRDLCAADIPAMPLHTLDTLIADEHLEATGFFELSEHPSEGRLRTTRIPSTWSRTQPATPGPAPRLGEQSRQVLEEADFTADEIEALTATGVVKQA